MQENLCFEPRYPTRRSWLLAGSLLPGLVGLVVSLAVGLDRSSVIFSVLALVALPAAMSSHRIRRIEFGETLVVVRFLLFDRYLKYAEITWASDSCLDTPRGPIRLDAWTNREAFLELLRTLRAAGKLTGPRGRQGS